MKDFTSSWIDWNTTDMLLIKKTIFTTERCVLNWTWQKLSFHCGCSVYKVINWICHVLILYVCFGTWIRECEYVIKQKTQHSYGSLISFLEFLIKVFQYFDMDYNMNLFFIKKSIQKHQIMWVFVCFYVLCRWSWFWTHYTSL